MEPLDKRVNHGIDRPRCPLVSPERMPWLNAPETFARGKRKVERIEDAAEGAATARASAGA